MRVFPAYAGMIRSRSASDALGRRAPRVCGDDPPSIMASVSRQLCSPRMRG